MESNDQNLGQEQPVLLDKINTAIKELGGGAKWKRTPEHLDGTEVLKDKTVVMVDDEIGVLEAFVPNLMVATDGKASFIRYDNRSLEQLVAQIQEAKADVVLLDYHLSRGPERAFPFTPGELEGSEVARGLVGAGFTGSIIGFSSDTYVKREFQDAGALGAINKSPGFPGDSVKELAQLLKS